MKYYVDFRVKGYYSLEIEATDYEQARDEANVLLCDIDFGGLEDIEWEPISVNDKNGKYYWEESL